MSNVYEKIAKLCHRRLLRDNDSMEYLSNRSISEESISKFEIGLFPQDLRELFVLVDPIELRTSGIIFHASSSRFKTQDLIFPVKNVYGEYIAIAGRTRLSESEREKKKIPKYMNSTYAKSQHLFGLNFAKFSVLKEDVVYVVEGYFDVINPHQNGIYNIVAVCGKYLSARHVILLSRYTNNIVLLFDNEEDAQIRAHMIASKRQCAKINLKVENPFDGTDIKDIDDYLTKYSARDFMRIMRSNNSIIE